MAQTFRVDQSRIFKDLVEYTGLHPQLVAKRCEYSPYELAVLWIKKKSVIDYYKSTDLYIFDLTKYQILLEAKDKIEAMIKQIKDLGFVKVLEYGGGIGEFSIKCHENEISSTYFDLDGKTKEYALWRFKKHECSKITVADSDPLEQEWDLVNVMDVLEHLEDPDEIVEKLAKKAKYIFCNPEDIKYNIYYPQHITKFDLTKFFERLDGYLWKNKNLN